MTNPSQLFLLADHIKLSLLERQRAISLNLEPNSQDAEISRSLESFKDGIESVESECRRLEENSDDRDAAAALRDQLSNLHSQYRDLSAQFHGDLTDTDARGGKIENPTIQTPNDPALAADFARAATSSTRNTTTTTKKNRISPDPSLKQPVPQHPTPSKSVRFMDNTGAAAAGDEEEEDDDPNRNALFQPYRDSPSPSEALSATNMMDNQQIHEYHSHVLREQDAQLDRLGESIGRQHQLSIEIGDELDGHVALLDAMDGDVERHQSRLDLASRRLKKIRKRARENWSLMTIVGLIIVLVILIVILK